MSESAKAYEACAKQFLNLRDESLIGSKIVEQWCNNLPAQASGIELGCGGGYPITQVLDKADVQLWAVDAAPTLVSVFKQRFPHIPIQCASVLECDFFNRQFDFAVAVGLLFLLDEADQQKLISDIAHLLLPEGRWLLTAPIETGRWIDTTSGIECLSLGQARYHDLFNAAGFRVKMHHLDHGKNNYYDLQL